MSIRIRKTSVMATVLMVGISMASAVFADQALPNTSLNQAAMGHVGIARGVNSDILLVNPAGLATAKPQVRLATFRGEVNDVVLNERSQLQAFYNAKTLSDRLDHIGSLVPSTIAFKGGASPIISMVQPGWGLGLFLSGSGYVDITNPVLPLVTIQAKADISPIVGVANTWTVMGQAMSVGVSARYISRYTVVDPGTGSTTVVKTSNELLTGSSGAITLSQATISGVGADIGVLMPLGDGRVGAVLSNLGSTLTGKTASGNAISEKIPTVFGVGYSQAIDASSIPLVGGLIGHVSAGADLNFVSRNIFKNLGLGLEKEVVPNLFSVQAGLYQGYPSLGFSLSGMALQFQYAYYIEERGDRIGDSPQAYHGVELGLSF